MIQLRTITKNRDLFNLHRCGYKSLHGMKLAALSVLAAISMGLSSSDVNAQPQSPEKSSIAQEHGYPSYSLTDNRVLEFERLYIESTQCSESCGALVELDIKRFDESSNMVEFILSYSANKRTLLPIGISQNDFDIISVTNASNSQNIPLIKKDKLYFLADNSEDIVSIKVIAKKKSSAQTSLLAASPMKVLSSATNVSVQNARNQFSLSFAIQKQAEAKPTTEAAVKNDIKTTPAYMLERTIILDSKWRMSTTLRSVTPTKGMSDVLEFKISTLEGEKVLTSGIESKGNVLDIKIKPGESVSWSSELTPNEKLNVPSSNGQFTQLVRILSKDSWEINPVDNSLKPVEINSDRNYKNGYSWFMWSNESLETTIDLYKYLEGQVVAVSDLDMKVNMNTIPTQVNMTFNVNSSIGGIYKFKNKNKDFKAVDLNINQAKMQADVKNDEISLMLKPGVNSVVLNFTYTPEDSLVFKAPVFDFNTQIVNSSLTVEDGKKWVLYAGGADVKPSILLWSVLVTLFVFSIIIFKSKAIDLGLLSLVLLLFGISQVGIDFVILTLLWFFMIKYRSSNTMEDFKTYFRFNAFQFGFAVLTIFVISGMISVVAKGLLLNPESFIAGYQSSFASLFWYSQEYSSESSPWLVSAPMWMYRVLMMAWAVWLAFNMLNWLKSCWTAFSNNGFWYKKPKNPVKENIEEAEKEVKV